MKRTGFAEGPFQLLINIVVLGMALGIGFYLFNMINCWKCDEALKGQAVDLKETLASIGGMDVGSKKNIVIKVEDLGHCAAGIYLKHHPGPCRSFCPNHPNACWVIIANSRCSGRIMSECIDINGDMDINANNILPNLQNDPDPWIEGSYAITHTVTLQIEKTGPNQIDIKRP